MRCGVPSCERGTPNCLFRHSELLNDLISSSTCLYVFPSLSFSARKDERSMPHLARTSSLQKLALCGVSLSDFIASLTLGSTWWCLNIFLHISCIMSTALTSLVNTKSQQANETFVRFNAKIIFKETTADDSFPKRRSVNNFFYR